MLTMEVRNRFKGLDLINRVPDELWTEVHDLYRRQGLRQSPRKRNAKKAKWLSEEVKGKGEKERYTHLNVEFQRIAKRDKKAFLSDQCKEIGKIIEWERLEISSRKLDTLVSSDTKRTFQCKEGHNKGQKWYGPNRSRRY